MALVKATGGPFCMDVTEVSNAQYGAFLASSPSPSYPSGCTNNNLTPSTAGDCPTFSPSGQPLLPVSCVDWCDAHAYCQVVGKRLCGKIGGGAVSSAQLTNAGQSEWYHACSDNGANLFPYGSIYGTKTCNGLDSNGTGRSDVGSMFFCVSKAGPIFDLSGNLREWENGCNGNSCPERGGAYLDSEKQSNSNNLTCKSDNLVMRTATSKFRGFRCCADPVTL